MLKVIRNLLLKIVDNIDAGNSNITEEEAVKIVDSLKRFTDKEKRLSKYAACEHLNISRATFDNYVRGILPTSATVADVYVAINSQYHDYAELFKNWFGDGIEQKIVESAIVFWFKDADCKAENKVVEYLGEY